MHSNKFSLPGFSKQQKSDMKRGSPKKSKSLFGPSPHCVFGPKAKTDSGTAIHNSINLENQKLTWLKPPENILIIKRTGSETNASFKSLTSWLINDKKLKVFVESKLLLESTINSDHSFQTILKQVQTFSSKCFHATKNKSIDLIITIGGDGTLLYAASLFQNSMPPVVAFNAGSLGFLTAHDLSSYSKSIESVLAGNATLMLRSRLRCKVYRHQNRSLDHSENDADLNISKKLNLFSSDSDNEEDVSSFLVLNEVVVNRGASQYICNLDLYLEGRRITTVQGDGLIISTPTGSTAYSVAAGASMVHPNVPSIMITPICPHSLSFRPIVVPSGVELMLTVSDTARGSACVSFDGQMSVEIEKGDFVNIRTSVHPAPCVCRSNAFDDWFDSLSECLQWNSRQNQKHL